MGIKINRLLIKFYVILVIVCGVVCFGCLNCVNIIFVFEEFVFWEILIVRVFVGV